MTSSDLRAFSERISILSLLLLRWHLLAASQCISCLACWVFTSFSWLCCAVLTTVRYDERRQNLNGKWRRDSPSESCSVKARGHCRRSDAIGRARGPFFVLVKECWAFLEPYSLSSRNDWTIGQNPTPWPGSYISFEELQIMIPLVSWILWLLEFVWFNKSMMFITKYNDCYIHFKIN